MKLTPRSRLRRRRTSVSQPLFQFRADRATFRIADTRPSMEEVSVTGTGVFKGRRFVTLYTVKVKVTDGSGDIITGNGIMYRRMGRGRATYRMRGIARGGSAFAEEVQGTIVFTSRCTGDLRGPKNMKTRFETTVDSAGVSRTTVWRAST